MTDDVRCYLFLRTRMWVKYYEQICRNYHLFISFCGAKQWHHLPFALPETKVSIVGSTWEMKEAWLRWGLQSIRTQGQLVPKYKRNAKKCCNLRKVAIYSVTETVDQIQKNGKKWWNLYKVAGSYNNTSYNNKSMPNKHVHESTQFIFQPHRSVCTDAAVRPTLRRPPPAHHPIPKGPQISLCRLQTTSRASMGQDRLSALAMQHVRHYMYKIDVLEVVQVLSETFKTHAAQTVCCSTDFDILGLSKY